MPRRKVITGREILPDPRYKSKVLAKLISRMMEDGKRSTSTKIVYAALEQLSKKSGKDAIEVFTTALENVKPMVEVKSRRVGGSTYQVPIEVRDSRREALAMRWIISASRSRSGRSMSDKLSAELFDASNSTGVAFKKKEDTHRMAEANKAFSHYKW